MYSRYLLRRYIFIYLVTDIIIRSPGDCYLFVLRQLLNRNESCVTQNCYTEGNSNK